MSPGRVFRCRLREVSSCTAGTAQAVCAARDRGCPFDQAWVPLESRCALGFQGWVLEILQSAARDARSAQELLRDYSLLTWVLHVLEGR